MKLEFASDGIVQSGSSNSAGLQSAAWAQGFVEPPLSIQHCAKCPNTQAGAGGGIRGVFSLVQRFKHMKQFLRFCGFFPLSVRRLFS